MTSILTGIALWIGLSAASPSATPASGMWEKLYEVPSRNSWISAVWLAKDGSWRAAGRGFIVSGGSGVVTSTDLGDYYVTSFGEDTTGVVVAVGGNQAIWEEKGSSFQLVHERAGPAPKGRAAHEDLLDGIGYLDAEAPERLVAYGSLRLSLWRDLAGKWRTSDSDSLAKLGALGPALRAPPGCHIAGWRWLDRTGAMFECHEGNGFLYKQGAPPTHLGRLPKPCQTSLLGVTRNEVGLFVACGDPAHVLRSNVDAPTWSQVSGVSDVTSVKARGRCLLVGTRRAIFRRCD